MTLRLVGLIAFPLLAGCATIVQGGGQNLTVTTNPAGASCRLEREGAAVGIIAPTPGTLRLDKSRQDLVVTCTREGHDATTVRHASEFGPATFGNILIGGLIGVTVDAISGANFAYPGELVINLQVTGGPPVVQPERPKPEAVQNTGNLSGSVPGAATIAAPPASPPAPKP